MTDQSKPTTDIPYTDDDIERLVSIKVGNRRDGSLSVQKAYMSAHKALRVLCGIDGADLVPAAPTCDKAAAVSAVRRYMSKHDVTALSASVCMTIINSLQENTAPEVRLGEIEKMTEEMDRYIPDALLKKLRAYFPVHEEKTQGCKNLDVTD